MHNHYIKLSVYKNVNINILRVLFYIF